MRSGASSTSIRSRFRCCIKENGIYKTNCSSHGYKYTGINVWNGYHLTEKIQAKQDDHYYQNRSSWKLVSSQLFVSRISRWMSRNWKSPHLLIIMGIWSNNLFFFKTDVILWLNVLLPCTATRRWICFLFRSDSSGVFLKKNHLHWIK